MATLDSDKRSVHYTKVGLRNQGDCAPSFAREASCARSRIGADWMLGSAPTRACFFLLAALTSAPWTSTQAAGQGLTLPARKDSVVRFFYQPPEGEYLHHPLLFRVVKKRDPRWNTISYLDVGRTLYISLSDMQQLTINLAHLPLQWDKSAEIEPLETIDNINLDARGMDIKVLAAKGTAKALIEHDKICETLAKLDGALLTPRALWEFQRFRLQYYCRVPGYNPDAYNEPIFFPHSRR